MLVHSLFEQLVPRVVGFCLCLGRNLQFWEFRTAGEQGECFPCFPGLVIMVCLNIIVLGTNWSRLQCVQCLSDAGDFGPVFVEGKAEYFK